MSLFYPYHLPNVRNKPLFKLNWIRRGDELVTVSDKGTFYALPYLGGAVAFTILGLLSLVIDLENALVLSLIAIAVILFVGFVFKTTSFRRITVYGASFFVVDKSMTLERPIASGDISELRVEQCLLQYIGRYTQNYPAAVLVRDNEAFIILCACRNHDEVSEYIASLPIGLDIVRTNRHQPVRRVQFP